MKPTKVLILISTLAIGLIALITQTACSGKSAETKAPSAEKPATFAVTTATAVEKMVASGFEQTGSFIADENSDVAPLVPGRVLSTPVDVGAWVKKGDVICELDHKDAPTPPRPGESPTRPGQRRHSPGANAHRLERGNLRC